jgi:hypothetical protein
LPAEVTLVSCDIAVKALSNDPTLSPEPVPEDAAGADGAEDAAGADGAEDAAGADGAVVAPLLHPTATIAVAASAAISFVHVRILVSPQSLDWWRLARTVWRTKLPPGRSATSTLESISSSAERTTPE